MARGNLADDVLRTWKANDGITLNLLRRIPAYLISHDSHHRGQIALVLKQNGMRLPDEVAIKDLWYEWYFGKT